MCKILRQGWSRWRYGKWTWEFSECFAECYLEPGNVERMREEENTMIKNIKINEANLDEEVNGFKKVDKNLLKDWRT